MPKSKIQHSIKDLHDYQIRVTLEAIKLQRAYLLLGTGLGKTVITMTVLDQLQKRGFDARMLVVAPKKVMYNTWRQEAAIWDHTQRFDMQIIHGDAGIGSSETVRRRALMTKCDIHLINYEGLPWLVDELTRLYGKGRIPWNMIVLDESTKMKHSTTTRFMKFKPLLPYFPYRFPMTGTPIPNGVHDIYGQFFCVDLGISLGRTLTSFRQRYFHKIGRGNYSTYEPRRGAKQRIKERIRKSTIYIKKTEYVKLPPLIPNPILLDLPEGLREQYDDFEEDFYIQLKDTDIEAVNEAVKNLKLRQFLQGRMYDEHHDAHFIHDEKLKILEELKEGIGNALIVYNFHFERDDLRTIFREAPAIDSRTSESEATKYLAQWDEGKLEVLLVNSASVSYGLNLQYGGHDIIWYSLTYNLEHFSQLIDRLWRQGQKNPVRVHAPLFRNTVDEVVFNALKQKEITQEELLGALHEYMEKRWSVTGNSRRA